MTDEANPTAMDQHLSCAFGLHWCSPELPIPELAQAVPGQTAPLIAIKQDKSVHWPPLAHNEYNTEFLRFFHDEVQIRVEGIGHFRVSSGDKISWQREHKSVSDQDLRAFLLGSAFGALLIQRRMLVMHGNAMERDGKAIVCLGHSGAGKSTLAYALMRQGWRLLADDLVVITPEGQVLPGIPRIKLWHDATLAFGLDQESLLPVRQGMKKYILMGDRVTRAPAAANLKAIYLINHTHQQPPDCTAGSIDRVDNQKQATLYLRNQAFRPRFVRGLGQEAANFIALANLQSRFPLSFITLPQGISQLQQWLERQEL